ncbi:serine/threonine protein kinase [Pendulispora rubella]|uniref:Serine/threonine protein kinase n=1 Tax=Pendulispora rubella TaxID=2741070 RepID=A0ABZ2L2L4_9BACT
MTPHETPRDIPHFEGMIVGGKYVVLHFIGAGGMGTVWAGTHRTLGTRVAIKFIREEHVTNPDSRRRFEIEARAAARLQSQHAVHVYDYGVTAEGFPYIVMEYLQGESLSELIIREGPVSAREAANIIRQAAVALDRAHAAGIVHRDLKPDNIFLTTTAEAVGNEYPYIVKLVDFGIAKIFEEPIRTDRAPVPMGGPTQEGAVIGTPNFMSPEQLTSGGVPGVLTDLWSLGASTFAALTARIPFEGEVLGDIVLKVCAEPMPVPSEVNPEVPPGFDAWFAKACAREPHRRFQSAAEMSRALDQVCGMSAPAPVVVRDDQVQYALKPASPEALAALAELDEPRSMSPRTALLAGLVLGVAVMIGVAGFIAYRDKVASETQEQLLRNPPAAAVPQPGPRAADAGRR